MEKLSIIIPVYNEVKTLNEILGQVQAVKIKLEKEIQKDEIRFKLRGRLKLDSDFNLRHGTH